MTEAQNPEQAVELVSRRISDRDVEGALALYEPDAVFTPGPGQAVSGHAEIREALARFTALDPTLTSTVRKVLRSGDVALVVNAWQLEGTGPDGGDVGMTGTSADVVRRQRDGCWLVAIDDPWGGTAEA